MAAAVLVPDASAARRTITMSGSTPTGALTADLAYFYRHSVRKPPRFSIVGGGSGTGIADAARGIVDVGLASRELEDDDPAGLRFSPIAMERRVPGHEPREPGARASRARRSRRSCRGC